MQRHRASITETLNKKALKIDALKYGCDVEIKVNPPLPKRCGWFLILCGAPGSGKSTMLNSLFATKRKAYYKKFQDTYLFGNGTVSLKKDPFKFVPKKNRYAKVTEETLNHLMDRLYCCGRRVLIVFDDVVSDFAFSGSTRAALSQLARNRRHVANGEFQEECFDTRRFPVRRYMKTVRVTSGSCSIVITTQNYNAVPRQCRMIASHLILFNCNEQEKMHIADELIAMPKKVFAQICAYTFKNPHDHLLVETAKGLQGFHRNFNALSISYSA